MTYRRKTPESAKSVARHARISRDLRYPLDLPFLVSGPGFGFSCSWSSGQPAMGRVNSMSRLRPIFQLGYKRASSDPKELTLSDIGPAPLPGSLRSILCGAERPSLTQKRVAIDALGQALRDPSS